MVRHDDGRRARTQGVGARHVEFHHAHALQGVDERAKEPVDHGRDRALARGAMRPQARERKNENREKQAAQPEHREAETGSEKAPATTRPH
jgi:hypothetical protein